MGRTFSQQSASLDFGCSSDQAGGESGNRLWYGWRGVRATGAAVRERPVDRLAGRQADLS